MAKRGPKGPSRYTPEYKKELAEGLIAFAHKCQANDAPMFAEEYAISQDVPPDVFSKMANKDHSYFNEDFFQAYKVFKKMQERQFAVGAMTGKFDSSFTKFAMKNICGWRDEQHLKGEGVANQVLMLVVPPNVASNGKPNRLAQANGVPITANTNGTNGANG